ncbi:beta-1,3-galactosyl-O-glycosyl-glycoprotein beta-1,6-N-acetylglucosaminyltransferase-like [Gadus chalcogrammus]|uniref:beta-1,3-galactosyl-O-glycosyl-glycoprotein beta-1,6-N-acetylglucosaminyltransferase-like n=1 Tax=Gadus chalcogrammus TaxID=1042646 RepID=UPI0024C22572|nr:beta-1,3-galactosyl-O-glycosyl-glycoprotein beta-1,6-N-acetylglucosaminyltransferase-like [Gadus chalcogrammus]XP_056448265.1 beta-1,3-galactosyl-O-glycosyl-glycoprotein beta-1,6-N-acetylglucosaminyltransferase-like [Gadus chalcogrammus]
MALFTRLGHGRRFTNVILRVIAIVALLWTVVFVISPTEIEWVPTLSWSNRWLAYKEYEGNVEDACNCSSLLQGDIDCMENAKLLSISKDFRKKFLRKEDNYINATVNCRDFQTRKKYTMFPLSKEEEDFPLAYSIVVHHKIQNFEHLLRAIYAPQNLYCVHVDKKASLAFLEAVMSITFCFPNVFMVSRPVDVVYAGWPRVQADINCMADLFNVSTKWKYFINLCGQDFPLKTNLEMVRSLKMLKGANSMETEKMPGGKRWRVEAAHHIVDGQLKATGEKKAPTPFDLPVMSGNAYILASRGYVQSVLQDQRVQQLIEWAKDSYSPDEFLWATIQRMPGVPGSSPPDAKYDLTDMNARARMVKWQWHEGPVYPMCSGHHVRSVCVYGIGDLQWLLEQHHFFANKFDLAADPIAIHCLEWYLRHKALTDVDQW